MAKESGSGDQLGSFPQVRHAMTSLEPLTPSAGTNAARLKRIAELLCKAVILVEADRALQVPDAADLPPESRDTYGDAVAKENQRVLNYLRLAGQASPLSIRSTLGLTRSAAYRALQRLTRNGLVVVDGQTRTVSYRLNQGEPAVEKIRWN